MPLFKLLFYFLICYRYQGYDRGNMFFFPENRARMMMETWLLFTQSSRIMLLLLKHYLYHRVYHHLSFFIIVFSISFCVFLNISNIEPISIYIHYINIQTYILYVLYRGLNLAYMCEFLWRNKCSASLTYTLNTQPSIQRTTLDYNPFRHWAKSH